MPPDASVEVPSTLAPAVLPDSGELKAMLPQLSKVEKLRLPPPTLDQQTSGLTLSRRTLPPTIQLDRVLPRSVQSSTAAPPLGTAVATACKPAAGSVLGVACQPEPIFGGA